MNKKTEKKFLIRISFFSFQIQINKIKKKNGHDYHISRCFSFIHLLLLIELIRCERVDHDNLIYIMKKKINKNKWTNKWPTSQFWCVSIALEGDDLWELFVFRSVIWLSCCWEEKIFHKLEYYIIVIFFTFSNQFKIDLIY